MFRYLFGLVLLVSSPVPAQVNPYPRQTIFAEAGGNGLGYSLNYERNLNRSVAVRLGVSWLQVVEKGSRKKQTIITVPLTVSYLINFGSSPHHAEIGGGINLVYGSGNLTEFNRKTDVFPNLTGIAGYRYQRSDGGLMLKAGFTPFYGMKTLTNNGGFPFAPLGGRFQPWGGIGIGYGF
ncbi:hypothetical protein BN8_00673 [Fibrisoma limi BUZ 3]|uniref:Outer membrane protein beta-barrel domain-containing protein n=1 Tax=Fibrisoma limi BUZ 3 TaxID=1185876 RepID=I2GCV6_9BACT|nr:hypothetical protein [Fibrisoma limi]CCH51730.1 hypothetical protein BN8_00673 [Fibrisoma limi BUZ 3]